MIYFHFCIGVGWIFFLKGDFCALSESQALPSFLCYRTGITGWGDLLLLV